MFSYWQEFLERSGMALERPGFSAWLYICNAKPGASVSQRKGVAWQRLFLAP
ncbi:hypothetical protein EV13_1642 [Prochlorococcus sp. MIT 0702]|nr:hypothetical protein EV13_1642 [Prochlorococcus sp. MIT 0702]KGG28706.1 hypothetical protein EV12_0601 [Prochlorococcus sp. MIT 0701]KGG36351.1 hypothetical protein EV14_0445 [Prochlorococcus sp. MIT 0703]